MMLKRPVTEIMKNKLHNQISVKISFPPIVFFPKLCKRIIIFTLGFPIQIYIFFRK